MKKPQLLCELDGRCNVHGCTIHWAWWFYAKNPTRYYSICVWLGSLLTEKSFMFEVEGFLDGQVIILEEVAQ